MIEHKSIQGYRIEEQDIFSDGRILRVVDEEGNTIADHTIVPESKKEIAFLNSRILCPQLEDTPYTVYVGAIHSFKTNMGIGTSLWKYGELEFFRSQSRPYYRFIDDMSENGWTQRRIPELLEYLESQNVPIKCIWEGKFLGERSAWIFLFGESN